MLSILNIWLGKVLSKLWLGVATVAAAATIYWRGGTNARKHERERQEARRTAELAEEQQQRIDAMKKRQEVKDEVDRLSNDSVADRLRRKWTKSEDR